MRIANVQFWKTQVRKGRPKPYQVRWAVDGRPFTLSYRTSALAEQFRNDLIAAARRGEHFDAESGGLPASMQPKPKAITWYEFALNYSAMKWPESAANSRKNTASSLTTITLYLLGRRDGMPELRHLRNTLRHWAFRPCGERAMPGQEAATLAWVAERSCPITDLLDLEVLRSLLRTLGTRQDGRPAKPSSTARHRAVLTRALNYAVEREVLPHNPVDRLAWRPPTVSRQVDPRAVASPSLVRDLLVCVTYIGNWEQQRGPRLMAFFACLYFAGMRPEEAVELKLQDCKLPGSGPGVLLLSKAGTRAGSAWTNDGRKHEVRGLKHRAQDDGRDVPIPPELVRILRRHLETFGTAPDGSSPARGDSTWTPPATRTRGTRRGGWLCLHISTPRHWPYGPTICGMLP